MARGRWRHIHPGCHRCAWEDADVCDRLGKHAPGNDFMCMDCKRNPKASKMPLVDRFRPERSLVTALLHGGRIR